MPIHRIYSPCLALGWGFVPYGCNWSKPALSLAVGSKNSPHQTAREGLQGWLHTWRAVDTILYLGTKKWLVSPGREHGEKIWFDTSIFSVSERCRKLWDFQRLSIAKEHLNSTVHTHTKTHTHAHTHGPVHALPCSLLMDGGCLTYETCISHSICSFEGRWIVTQGVEKPQRKTNQTQITPYWIDSVVHTSLDPAWATCWALVS